MDDLKIYHMESTVVDDILQCLEEHYVKVPPLTTIQGKIHNYLGMVLDFSMKGKARVTISKHI